jgi:uncharacterized protein YeaO (DUF488 family)
MIRTKRWCDKVAPDDGIKVLVCRYRPRALEKKGETWTIWKPEFGPSKELHAAFYGKSGQTPITWEEFRQRYLEEMKAQEDELAVLAELVAAGKTVTLMCSQACTDESTCHRSLLRELIEQRVALLPPASASTPAQAAAGGDGTSSEK